MVFRNVSRARGGKNTHGKECEIILSSHSQDRETNDVAVSLEAQETNSKFRLLKKEVCVMALVLFSAR